MHAHRLWVAQELHKGVQLADVVADEVVAALKRNREVLSFAQEGAHLQAGLTSLQGYARRTR